MNQKDIPLAIMAVVEMNEPASVIVGSVKHLYSPYVQARELQASM